MTIANVNTSGLETMTTKDSLIFLRYILEKHSKAKNVYTNVWLDRFDRVFDKMIIIEAIIQVESDAQEMKYYHLSLSLEKSLRFLKNSTITSN